LHTINLAIPLEFPIFQRFRLSPSLAKILHLFLFLAKILHIW
jgi:hypothetical protein